MNPLEYHKQLKGKWEIVSRAAIETKEDLALAYTPGVAEPCKEIARDKTLAYAYTRKGNLVAVISDGSAVLGLGNIGPEAAMPVMDGKCVLFKRFAGVDAVPIVLSTQNTVEIIAAIKAIAPSFGGINLEDIAAPRCFEVERALRAELDIPVFHDDQHGTAIVVLAGLMNALKVVNKELASVRIVLNGAGAAGIAIAELLLHAGVTQLRVVDSVGMLSQKRTDMNEEKMTLARKINTNNETGNLAHALLHADVFIGVSKGGVLTADMVRVMAPRAIVFAMANPVPEIFPDEAKAGGAEVVATGRSDFANQINNVLVFPGVFRGLLDKRLTIVTKDMEFAAAKALSLLVKNPSANEIIPSPFLDGVADVVAQAVIQASK